MLDVCWIGLLGHLHHKIGEGLIQRVIFCDVRIRAVLSGPGVDVGVVVTIRADH